jgi:hypothetical protein
MHKLHRAKSAAGAAQLLEVALVRLRDTPENTLGVSVAELITDVERIYIAVEEVSSRSPIIIDPAHVPQIRTRS